MKIRNKVLIAMAFIAVAGCIHLTFDKVPVEVSFTTNIDAVKALVQDAGVKLGTCSLIDQEMCCPSFPESKKPKSNSLYNNDQWLHEDQADDFLKPNYRPPNAPTGPTVVAGPTGPADYRGLVKIGPVTDADNRSGWCDCVPDYFSHQFDGGFLYFRNCWSGAYTETPFTTSYESLEDCVKNLPK